VAALLASQGYEPRYGARPLKRALERQLLAPLAERVNAFSAQSALRGDAVLAGAELKITVKARLDELGRPISPAAALPQCAASARAITDLRRLFQRIEHCSAVAAMRNDLFQLERLERVWLARLARRKPGAPAPKNPLDPPQQARLSFIRQFLMSLEEHARRSRGIEDDALETLYGPASHESVAREHLELLDHERGVLDLAARAAMLELYSRGFANPDLLSLALFSESRAQMFQLADAYRELAEKWKCRLLLWRFLLPGPKMALSERDKVIRKLLNPEGTFWESDVQFEAQTFVPQLRRVAVAKPERYLQEVDGEAVGLVLGIEGPAAFLRLGPEDGLHLLRSEQVNAKVLVQVEGTLIARYLPPVGVARRGFVSNQPLRRVYDFARGTVDDAGEICQWADRKLTPMIEELIEDRLRNDLEMMLEE